MFDQSQIIALILVVVSAKLFFDHRRQGYQGEYRPAGNYDNISAVKHDLFKAFVVELIPLLIYGLGTDKFFDMNRPLESWLGKTMVIVSGYFIFHELIQPYIVNKLPYW